MTVIMREVEYSLNEQEKTVIEVGRPSETEIDKLFYADDAMLLTTTAPAVESLLNAVERESAK